MFTLTPLIWELRDDRHGESLKDKRHDIYVRIVLALIGAALDTWILKVNFFAACFMALAEFWLLFDYIEAIQLKHKDWFVYIGKTGWWANFKLWNRIGPWGRLLCRFVAFSAALILYNI